MSASKTIGSFEKSLNELERLVKKMEQGELPLEKSLALFEQGMALTRSCQQMLATAEQKVQLLVEGEDGHFQLSPTSIGQQHKEQE